jgi:hypothetical protein
VLNRQRTGRLRHLLLLGCIVALLTAACSGSEGDDSTDASVRPFADVQDSELAFEIDPNDPSRAIFHVTTTIPMICSITWVRPTSWATRTTRCR